MTSSAEAEWLFLANLLCWQFIFRKQVVHKNFRPNSATMGKIADVQLHSKAVILAQEGYSYSVIG